MPGESKQEATGTEPPVTCARAMDVAGEWREEFLNGRKEARQARCLRVPPEPVAKSVRSSAEIAGATNSARSAECRLADLESKVDRILRALEKDGRDHMEAPSELATLKQRPEKPGKASGSPAQPGEERGTVAEKPLTGDLAKIQGAWKEKTGGDKHLQFAETFNRNAGAFDSTTSKGKKFGGTFRFEIDESAKPHRRIHLHDIRRYGKDRGYEGNAGGPNEVFGIYKFMGDNNIMICNRFDGKYPAGFENGEVVFTLKREPEVEKTEK